MIRDLLPLYKDQACSKASAEAVEEHLAECPDCTGLLEEMNSFNIEETIKQERNDVIKTQAKYFKRKSAIVGTVIGAVFSLPILICLIVDLVSGSGLSWFFIVLAAMLIPASLIVVPLMAEKNKGLWTIGSFAASLTVLLAVCCIYSGGSWFFTAAFSVIFGLALIFTPFIVRAEPVAKRLGNNKLFTVAAVYTLTFVLMMLSIGLSYGKPGFFRTAAACSLPALVYVWGLFLLIRLPKWNGYLKAACCIAFSALMYFFSDAPVLMMLGQEPRLPQFGAGFTSASGINDSISWIILISGAVIAAVMAVIGAIKNNSGRNNK